MQLKLFYKTGNLWFYSKSKANNFNANIDNTNAFKSFEYKTKLLWDTVAQLRPNNNFGILKNPTIGIPLK